MLGHTINAGDLASGGVAAVDLASDAGVCSVTFDPGSGAGATKCSGPSNRVGLHIHAVGDVCFKLPFTPKGGAVTIDGSVGGFPLAYLNLAPLPAGNCPAGFNAEVTTYSAMEFPKTCYSTRSCSRRNRRRYRRGTRGIPCEAWILGVCGLRWSEAIALHVGDIDVDASVIKITNTLVETEGVFSPGKGKTKGSAGRVSMPDAVAQAFREHLLVTGARRPGDLLFTARGEGSCADQTFGPSVWHPAVERAAAKGYTARELRQSRQH